MATSDKKVLKFLQDENRPYLANDIAERLKLSLPIVQKALAKYVNDDQVVEKCYGKVKIYHITQELEDEATRAKRAESIREMDKEIKRLAADIKKAQEEYHKKVLILKSRENEMSLDEAEEHERSLQDEIKRLNKELEKANGSSASNVISDEERAEIVCDYKRTLAEYKKRKSLCTEMVDSIMEGYPKTKKQLLEEIEIETDEDAGFSLPKPNLKN